MLTYEEYMALPQSTRDEWEAARLRVDPILPGVLYISGIPDNDEVFRQVVENRIGLMISTTQRTPRPVPNTTLVRYPFSDTYERPNEAELRTIGEFAARWFEITGQPILAHCAYGLNRSALISAFVMHELTGWDGDEILEHLRMARPGCLHNRVYASVVRSIR